MFQAIWSVFKGGYLWTRSPYVVEWDNHRPESDGPFLSTGEHLDVTNPHRTYSPWDEPELFRTFAGTPPTQAGILKFANQYGLLWRDMIFNPQSHMVVPRFYKGEEGTIINAEIVPIGDLPFMYGEALDHWQRAILEMRQVLDLWELATRGDNNKLAELFDGDGMDKAGAVIGYLDTHPERGFARGERIHELCGAGGDAPYLHTRMWFGDLGPCDHAHLAFRYVWGIVKARLETVQVKPVHSGFTPFPTRLMMSPSTLHSALWLQLAHALQVNRNHQQCPSCLGWFEVSPTRRNKVYCDNPSCRNRAQRDRKARALAMYENGAQADVIAARVGSKLETVKGWIKQAGR